MIKEKAGKWLLYTRDGSRVLGTHPTRERAMAQERAILVRQHMAKQGRSEAASRILGRVAVEVAEAAARGAAAKKGKGTRAIKPRLEATPKDIERWKTIASQKPRLKKKAEDVSSMAVPEGLLYEATSGDPRSAAELRRLEEAHARKVFSLGSEGPIRSVLARALLGRTRTEGATTEVERKLLEARPELSRLSAAARPEESYPVSRAVTTPALVAVPAAGVGAVLARLAAQAAGASPSEREIATAAGAGLGGVAGSMATYGLRQRHAKQMGRWLHEKDRAEREAARRQALALQEQMEGDVPQEGRMLMASIDVPELIPHFLESLSMIKEARGLLRLFGLGGARGVEQAAAQAAERAVAQGAERAALRGAAEAETRAAARSGAKTLSRIEVPRAEMAEQFRRIAQALPEGDPRRMILEAEATKMLRQLPTRPNVPGGIRMREIEQGAISPIAEGMVAAPGQEGDLIRALLGETEAVGALRQAGRLPGAMLPAAPRMTGELADLQSQLAGVGLPVSSSLPKGSLVPFEEVEGMVLPASESAIPGYGSSILPPPPLPSRAPVPVPRTQAQPIGVAPTLQAPVPGALTEMIPGARSPGVGGVPQLVEPPVFGQMAIPTERLSAQGLVPSEYFRMRTPGYEPMFAFAGPGAPPGRTTMQMRAILSPSAGQPIETAEILAPRI